MRFGQDGFVSTGFYRTRDRRIVAILGPHPELAEMFISPSWSGHGQSENCWWTTGLNLMSSENDLIERIDSEER